MIYYDISQRGQSQRLISIRQSTFFTIIFCLKFLSRDLLCGYLVNKHQAKCVTHNQSMVYLHSLGLLLIFHQQKTQFFEGKNFQIWPNLHWVSHPACLQKFQVLSVYWSLFVYCTEHPIVFYDNIEDSSQGNCGSKEDFFVYTQEDKYTEKKRKKQNLHTGYS